MISFRERDESVVIKCPECGALIRCEWDWDIQDGACGTPVAWQSDFEATALCDCMLDAAELHNLSLDALHERQKKAARNGHYG
jgi:hypothetical protein